MREERNRAEGESADVSRWLYNLVGLFPLVCCPPLNTCSGLSAENVC